MKAQILILFLLAFWLNVDSIQAQCSPLVVTGSSTQAADCPSSGSVTISASGTNLIYQLIAGPPNYPTASNSTGIFNSLQAGNYVAQVTDGCGAMQTTNFTIANAYPTYSVTAAEVVPGTLCGDFVLGGELKGTMTGDCACTDYIYLNDAISGEVHKFGVDSGTGALSEIGSPWLGFNSTENAILGPHGIATDINGFLYISSRGTHEMFKLKCDGTFVDVVPSTSSVDPLFNGFGYNYFSIGNILYINQNDDKTKVDIMDLCTGQSLGCVALPTMPNSLWGLLKGNDNRWYATNVNGEQILSGPLDTSLYTNTCAPGLVTVECTASQLGLPNAGVNSGWGFTGIAQVPDGTFYVQWSANLGFDGPSTIYHVDLNTCSILGQSLTDSAYESNTSDGLNWNGARGLVYSPSSNLLYVASAEDCVAAFDLNLNYIESASNHIALAYPKAIGLTTECCPVTTPLSYNQNICSKGNGEKIFLQELLDCGEGIICEGMWTQTTNSSGGAIVFNECDLSIVVNGSGCATYTLEKTNPATGNQQCGVFHITLTVCTQVPEASVTAVIGTCSPTSPNNNASIFITSAVNADQAGISTGSTYTGPAYGGTGTINISSGSGTFTNLTHNTQYTVRVFNGSNDCYVDYTVTTPDIQCCAINAIVPQNIECFDNSTPTLMTDNRLRFTATVTNTNPLLTTYNVSVNGGTNISPISGTYGLPVIYTLGPGTAGGGATFTITVTDNAISGCSQTFQVTDPNNCSSTVECPTPNCGQIGVQVNGN